MSKNKRLCTVVDLPTKILASLFAPLKFAGLQNHFPLKPMSGPNDTSHFRQNTSANLTVIYNFKRRQLY